MSTKRRKALRPRPSTVPRDFFPAVNIPLLAHAICPSCLTMIDMIFWTWIVCVVYIIIYIYQITKII